MKLHLLSCLASAAILAATSPLEIRQAPNPSASVDTGSLTGTTTTFASSTATVNQFLGIPFGSKPPRFSPPAAAPKWSGIYDASKYKPACVQQFSYPQETRDFIIAVFNTPPPPAGEDEDCLNLNVFAPAATVGAALKPVMFWIYGGAFSFGAGSLPLYDGSHFAADQDIVIVTINYRTNIFGFPGYPNQPANQQNLGLLDQRLALDWTRRNIKAFGGDPDKITIFGESAGAGSVDTLVTDPPKPVPFRAAIMESGQASIIAQNTDSRDSWNKLAANLSKTPEDAVATVEAMPATQLKALVEELELTFFPVKGDGATWSATPRRDRQNSTAANPIIARVPILIGSNANEGTIYAAPENATAYGDFNFQCPAKYVGEESIAAGIPTWRYYFNATFPNNTPFVGAGAFHSSEVPEVFGTYKENAQTTTRQRDLSKAMMKAWADFAKDPTQGPGWAQAPRIGVFGGDGQPVFQEVDAEAVDQGRCAQYKVIYDTYIPI
ncbi:carboxylesterase [Lophiotrema nucula]|uniref:Carboxylic ester hydrolase n=1 Tax=Lophiotrema nucula TaxID=690887 RepID=A0A6A5YWG4_9PLEO|nr:carboxylesterase [Lophiotrema nucula]